MNARQMALAGAVAARLGSGTLAKVLAQTPNARVTCSHFVFQENLSGFRTIARFLTSRRAPLTPQQFFDVFHPARGRPLENNSLLFTFDDGLLSSYEAATRVLEPMGIRAVFFVPTAVLELETESEMRQFVWDRIYLRRGTSASLRTEEFRVMGPNHLKALHGRGHMVLPHTHTHMNLRHVTTPELVERELRHPKRLLEALLQSPAEGFAPPIGTERIVSTYSFHNVRNVYALSFTMLGGTNTLDTNPFELHRDWIEAGFSPRHVERIMDGVYDPFYRVKARRLRRRVRPSPSLGRAGQQPGIAPNDRQHNVTTVTPRVRFVEHIATEFEAAGINYAVLHGARNSTAADSDIDVAVDRNSLPTVDRLIRSGRLGRLIQRSDYAIPWCRAYIVESDEPARRYRQLDVACDPWGIGPEGVGVELAVADRQRLGRMWVSPSCVEALHLAAKRASKRMYRENQWDELRAAFARDPLNASRLLGEHFGNAGARLATALARRERDLQPELEVLRRRGVSLRRTPLTLVRRALFELLRIVRRVRRPTGFAVAIVGPDGVGKSALAMNLEQAFVGVFAGVERMHLSPRVLPSLHRSLRREPQDVSRPHSRAPSGRFVSVMRVLYLWTDTAVGWWPRVALPRIRRTLVLIERDWLDLAVDPIRYRLGTGTELVQSLRRVLPRPDLVLRLEAPVAAIEARKDELERHEIARQLRAWCEIAHRSSVRFEGIDTSGSPEATRMHAVRAIEDRLAYRHKSLERCALALECLGDLHRDGVPYTIIRASSGLAERFPRWVLPMHARAKGPLGMRLYRQYSLRTSAAAFGLELAQRVGGGRVVGERVWVAPQRGLAPAIATTLELKSVELAAAVTGGQRRGGRVLLSVVHRGRIVAFAKVVREESWKLVHERSLLEALEQSPLETLVVPKVLGFFGWRDCSVLLLGPISTPGSANRAIGEAEFAALAELSQLERPFAEVLGATAGLIPMHGDFTPWNSAVVGRKKLALWDWESAQLGLPLEDLFFWRIHVALRSNKRSAAGLVASAVHLDPEAEALLPAGGEQGDVGIRALRAAMTSARNELQLTKGVPPAMPRFLDELERELA